MFQPFDQPLSLKLRFNFSYLTNLCHDNLKIIEIVRVIEPWAEWVGVLYLPTILLMKSKFHFMRFAPS